ncbi:MAG: hypothetical protein E6I23_10790 [Chloroflexi bacterium]|nr:MAG: hypothetical protein E6I23_10790 [Chloroflexota bacterium]
MGLILAMIVKKRWLALSGLVIATTGIVLGAVFQSRTLAGISILIGGALMLIQIPFGVRRDIRVLKEMQTKPKP